MRQAQRGFTIIEIAIAVAVLATVTIIFAVKMSGNIEKTKRTDLQLAFKQMSHDLKQYTVEHAGYPVGTSTLFPDKPCCEFPDSKCPAQPTSQWLNQPGWRDLAFHIDEPTHYRYRYTGTSKEATITAVGDPECSNPKKETKLHATIDANGIANVRIDE